MFLKNRNNSSKIKRSKVADYAALKERQFMSETESLTKLKPPMYRLIYRMERRKSLSGKNHF